MKEQIDTSGIQNELETTLRQQKLEAVKTEAMKGKFIKELKSGLGEQIKANPSQVEIILPEKPTFKQKIINFFKKF